MTEWFNRPNAAVAFCIALEALRGTEGDSVEVLCDDPEADDIDQQCAVEVCGDWTGYEKRRFYGRDPLAAIIAAGAEQARAR